jgi:hypothetical protein
VIGLHLASSITMKSLSHIAFLLAAGQCKAGSEAQAPLTSEHPTEADRWIDIKTESFHEQYIFSNSPAALQHDGSSRHGYRIPTSYESAVMARRILHLTSYGQLTSTYPYLDARASSSSPSSSSLSPDAAGWWPAHLAGAPVTLMEYIADCEPDSGNPTLLAVDIATPYVNYRAGSNISLSFQWTPPRPERCYDDEEVPSSRTWAGSISDSVSDAIDRWLGRSRGNRFKREEPNSSNTPALPYSAAKLPRFALFGTLEEIEPPTTKPARSAVEDCFLATHPDSHLWLPGRDDSAHVSRFMRLVVEDVYWFGGFGDRAYIGWIDVEKEWKKVTREEWEAIRLPGEKGGKGTC